jgi:mevalonate kinase
MFKRDLKDGLYLDSDIPFRYGLGSSGALVAAIFDRYGTDREEKSVLPDLKLRMALIESFFHGESSGIDPLCIYLNSPLHIQGNDIELIDLNILTRIIDRFFLLDTGTEANTGFLMNRFLIRLKDKSFNPVYFEKYIPAVNSLFRSIVAGDTKEIERMFREISVFQFNYLPDFIPQPLKKVWETGISSSEYYIKFCGAGGGGFLIVFSGRGIEFLKERTVYGIFPAGY